MPDNPIAAVFVDNTPSPAASPSAVAWPAIIGGAFGAAALTLVMIALGSGLGLASVSPWSNVGASAATFSIFTAVWLILTQWLASALGGYLTGRLRTKWTGLHTHEVFFRDTANGFLTWATASTIGAVLLAIAASSVVGGTAKTIARTEAASTVADPMAYFVDSLYRSDRPDAIAADADLRAQSSRILLNGDVPPADRAWLAQRVSARTGLTAPEAGKRVEDTIAQEKAAATKARAAVDADRKAGAEISIFTALSMLIGAFIACVAAALGGRERDAL